MRWKSYPGNIGDFLNNFTYVDQLDIIKFLPDTFDALFGILDVKQGLAIAV